VQKPGFIADDFLDSDIFVGQTFGQKVVGQVSARKQQNKWPVARSRFFRDQL
jgi:hypothetical protein